MLLLAAALRAGVTAAGPSFVYCPPDLGEGSADNDILFFRTALRGSGSPRASQNRAGMTWEPETPAWMWMFCRLTRSISFLQISSRAHAGSA